MLLIQHDTEKGKEVKRIYRRELQENGQFTEWELLTKGSPPKGDVWN